MAASAEKAINIIRNSKGFDKVLKAVKIISASNGSVTAELKVEEEHVNVMGTMHGGLSATLVDVISSMGLLTHQAGLKPAVSVNMNLSYFSAAKLGDTVQIVAETLKTGKSLAFLEVMIKNKETGAVLVKLISAEKGRCWAEFQVTDEHLNYMNGLHGGYSATIVDKYTSAALHTIIDDDYTDVTVNLNMSYLKGAKLGDTVLIDTRSLKVGENLAFLEAYLKNKETNELLVYGSQILFLVPPKEQKS
ncbi:thioesterase superfamily member-related [Holotrichia oblita]|uniref:Thioesterase superfamily member-related n=1 Tax=Holotrichia oblita TaxID=644536 RepID=A0ACB9T053_HOLOL|nr:thioesterase superfamily member-related [Holotrichia oblita]